MQFRQLIMREVQALKPGLREEGEQVIRVTRALRLNADENLRHVLIGNAVIELRHRAVTDQVAELAVRTPLFRNRHRVHRLFLFTHGGAFRHEAQTLEIHIRAAVDRDKRLSGDVVVAGPGLGAGDTERARGFNDRAGVIKNVLDGRAHFVRIDENDVIHILAADAEGLIAHRLHRGTIREETDL